MPNKLIITAVAAAFVAAFTLPVFAQVPRERPKPEAKGDIFHPTDIQSDVATFLTKLAAIDEAVSLSTAIPGLQDPVGSACWQQFSPVQALIKLHPLPVTFEVASDIEAARLAMIAMNQVCANPNCGQMFVDATNAASALVGNPLNVSLQSICAHIPVIGTNAVPTSAAKPAPIGTTVAPAAPVAPAPAKP